MWEAVVVIQTLCLCALNVFGYSLGAWLSGMLMNACLCWILLLLSVCKPYHPPKVNSVMIQCICCLVLTAYVALTFLPTNGADPGRVYKAVMGAVVLFVNTVFVLRVLWMLCMLVDWKLVHEACMRVVGCKTKLQKQHHGAPVESTAVVKDPRCARWG